MYNLLQELNNAYGYIKKIDGVVVYGRVMYAIEPVGYLTKQSITSGYNVMIDVVGIGIDGETIPSRGTLVAVLDDDSYLGKYVSITNGNRNGTTSIRAAEKGKEMRDSINVRNFRKSPEGWVIAPNEFKEMTKAELQMVEIRTAVSMLSAATGDVEGKGQDDGLFYRGLPKSDTKVKVVNGVGETTIELSDSDLGSIGEASDVPWSETPEETASSFADEYTPEDTVAEGDEPSKLVGAALVHRLEIAPKYELDEAFTAEVERSAEARNNYHAALIARASGNDLVRWQRDLVIMGFVKAFIHQGDSKLGNTQQKRRIVMEAVIDKMDIEADTAKTLKQEIRYNASMFYDGTSGIKEIENRWGLFFAILDVCVGTDNYRKRNSETPGKVFLSSPYDHATMYGKSPEAADKAFFLLSMIRNQGYGDGGYSTPEESDAAAWVNLDQETERRDILLATSRLVDESEGSTLIPKNEIFKDGYSIGYGLSKVIVEYGMPYFSYEYSRASTLAQGIASIRESDIVGELVDLREPKLENYGTSNGVSFGDYNYESMKWKHNSNDSTLELTAGVSLAQTLDDNGLAIEVGSELISSLYMEMEHFIYQKSYEMGSILSGVTQEAIDKAIADYEAEKGFKLEELQKDGIRTVMYQMAILSGQAGSGKTTVSEVMVGALKNALPDYQIRFAAPTGKAARRMKEVLGDLGEVRTIHSLFKIGIGSVNLFNDEAENEPDPSEEKIAYIIDESAMCTVPLMYKILKGIGSNSLVYFLGDVKQLPPIGKGMPFRDMMNYLPCVELGVSKRAKEGSGINKNCDLINQFSEPNNYQNLIQADDFRFASCPDSSIPDTVLKGVKAYIEKHSFTAEDIVVATPFATPKKPYGSKRLNPRLQELFLPKEKPLYTHKVSNDEGRMFKKGARVIHVSTNRYGKRKYRLDGQYHLVQEPSAGIVNGEVGILKGIVKYNDVTITLDDEYNSSMEFEGVELEDDTPAQKNMDKTYFVMVEVDDVDLGRKVIVLYQGIEKGKDEFNGVMLQASELWQVDLAYALTVHKMQGSQSRMVVIPLGSRDNPEFVNRNMLYTAVSRAQERVAVVGSVGSDTSMLENARKVAVQGRVRSVLSVMSGTKDMVE